LKGIEVSLSSCKFSYLDYTNEDEPRGLILPLQEKKRRNLKFARFLKGAMVIVKTYNQTRHGRHQICSVFFPRNEIEETSLAINKLLAIWQFLFTIRDQLHINNIYDTSKEINVETKKSKKSNKKT